MTRDIPPSKADRTQLQQIIAGLNYGVILIDPDQTISWANRMALALHGVTEVNELGATAEQASKQFDDAQAKIQQAKAQAVQTAKNAADVIASGAAKTSFGTFATLLIGAIAAAVGGSMAVQRRVQVSQRLVR